MLYFCFDLLTFNTLKEYNNIQEQHIIIERKEINMLNLVNYYNTNILGYSPDELNTAKTEATIAYLKDNKFTDEQIIYIMQHIAPHEAFIPSMLPEELWSDSLLRKDALYLHKELRIYTESPRITKVNGKEVDTDLYNEMKIEYTIDDLLEYFYKTLNICNEIRNYKQDVAQFSTLLNKYKTFNSVDGIELLLDVIDQMKDARIKVFKPFDLDVASKIADAGERLHNSKLRPEARIIWRGALKN